ncbi:hypothetical protein LTR70_008503 [Exophiala xenobiotica]|uniref:Uncharacterized protein n=1 Tax=Lithohypha guttulata TaxID=1690604 RepID=A0ABR0K4S6_9EURO|nr:hypothetical protein LTR24_007031 [Lithohypha guttulata]KAK5311934.1 hypothetical protein LTR70_008503 [Exophiala xenobiotica]
MMRMPALDANVAPNSTKGIESTIQNIRKDLKILNNTKRGKGKQALRSLESNVQALQHSLDHPGKGLREGHKRQTRKFLCKANADFQKLAAKLGHTQPIRSAEGKKETKPANKAVSNPTSNPSTTGIIDLTGGTSEDDVQGPDSDAAVGPSPLWFFDSSAAPVTISSQADDQVPGQSAQVATTSKEDDAEARGGLQTSAAGQEQADTTTSATLVSKLHQAKMSPCEGSYSNVRGSTVNETDVLEDLQALARKQGYISFAQEASIDPMRDAAMDHRDHELWYDPTVDFDQDLLP